jgi:hypothetical protein
MADRRSSRESIGGVWREFGRNLAVAAGALTALCSLVFHAPVWLASLRGAAVLAGLLFVNRISCAAIAWTESKRAASPARRAP